MEELWAVCLHEHGRESRWTLALVALVAVVNAERRAARARVLCVAVILGIRQPRDGARGSSTHIDIRWTYGGLAVAPLLGVTFGDRRSAYCGAALLPVRRTVRAGS